MIQISGQWPSIKTCRLHRIHPSETHGIERDTLVGCAGATYGRSRQPQKGHDIGEASANPFASIGGGSPLASCSLDVHGEFGLAHARQADVLGRRRVVRASPLRSLPLPTTARCRAPQVALAQPATVSPMLTSP
jgi:hypothetical protein